MISRNHGIMVISIVAATTCGEEEFWAYSPLGQSLDRLCMRESPLIHISYSNRAGLPSIFNAHLTTGNAAEAIVFVHDDVWIDDYFLFKRVDEGLQRFDIIGVAGNRRRLPRQPAWCFKDTQFTWDDPDQLSGVVAHGDYPFGVLASYGDCPAECELLDGVLLAVKTDRIVHAQVRFDPIFKFHFYDLDFCRQARQAGLKMGTWPIAITHQSDGLFGSKSWLDSCQQYLLKWGEATSEEQSPDQLSASGFPA